MFKGKQIRDMREEKNLSLSELARKAGLSVSYLSEIERGHKTPSIKIIEKLCSALNTSTREFIGEQEGTKNGQCIHLGQRIRWKREKKSMSQGDLSRLTGLSLSYICEIEAGNVFPSVNTLNNIASVLEVNVKSLVGHPHSLGKKLRHLREEMGMNQAQLAKSSGLSHGLIGQLERGQVQPSLKTLEKLSKVLNVSPCYLVSEEDHLEDLLNLLTPDVKNLLREPEVQAVLRMLRNCNEKEVRFILDFIKMFKQSNLGD